MNFPPLIYILFQLVVMRLANQRSTEHEAHIDRFVLINLYHHTLTTPTKQCFNTTSFPLFDVQLGNEQTECKRVWLVWEEFGQVDSMHQLVLNFQRAEVTDPTILHLIS